MKKKNTINIAFLIPCCMLAASPTTGVWDWLLEALGFCPQSPPSPDLATWLPGVSLCLFVMSFLIPVFPYHKRMLWGQMRWLSVTSFPALFLCLSIWGSDLQGPLQVLDEKTTRLCQKWKEAGWSQAEARQDAEAGIQARWNSGLATGSHIKVGPVLQNTRLRDCMNIIRDSIILSLFKRSGAKLQKLCSCDFLPFTTEYSLFVWARPWAPFSCQKSWQWLK